MQTSKRVICSAVLFLLIFGIFITPFIAASGKADRLNGAVRIATGEQITIPKETDFLFCGASHCVMGFAPELIDPALHVSSYNLSILSMELHGRYELLKNILPSHQIDTVVLEYSYDSLTATKESFACGDIRTVQHFGKYVSLPFKTNAIVTEYLPTIQNEYHICMEYGLSGIINLLTGSDTNNSPEIEADKTSGKGFEAYPSVPCNLSESRICPALNSESVDCDIPEDSLGEVERCIDLCQKYGAEVLIVVVPVADSFIWAHNNLDDYFSVLSSIAHQKSCPFIDFNLLKSRYELFDDQTSYYDSTHLSETGAYALSNAFSEIMTDIQNGVDISSRFFADYNELKEFSPYMEYYRSCESGK